MKKLESLGRSLSKDEQKKIMGGSEFDETEDEYGCGTSISCSGKSEGDKCGSKLCLCEKRSSTDNTLYCSTQI